MTSDERNMDFGDDEPPKIEEPKPMGHTLFRGIKPRAYKRGRFFIEDYSKRVQEVVPPVASRKFYRGRFEITLACITKGHTKLKDLVRLVELQQIQIDIIKSFLFGGADSENLDIIVFKSSNKKVETSISKFYL